MLVASGCLAVHLVIADQTGEMAPGLAATLPRAAVFHAGLDLFRGIYALKADALTADYEAITIADIGVPRDGAAFKCWAERPLRAPHNDCHEHYEGNRDAP